MKRKYSPCAHKLVKASDSKIILDEAEDILKDAQSAQEKLEAGGWSSDSAILKSVSDYFDNQSKNLKRRKYYALNDMNIKRNALNFVQGLIDNNSSVNEALFAYMFGINSPLENTRYSVDLKKDVVTASYARKYISTLEKEGLIPFLQSEQFDSHIMKDLWELSYERKPISNSPQANRIAEITFDMLEQMRKRLNKAGASINNMQGFIISQTHDIDTMLFARKQKWVEFVKPMIDLDRSFNGTVDANNIDKALGNAYEALVTDVRISFDTEGKKIRSSGAFNLAESISQPRQIVFKTAEDFINYKQRFGRNTLNESIVESIRQNSQDIALLENLGTRPLENLREIIQRTKENNREKIINKPKIDIFDSTIDSGINVLLGVTGKSRKWQQYVNSIKNYNILTMLGRSLWSQATDLAFKAGEYHHQGRSFLSSWAATFNDIKNGFKSDKDKKHFSSLVGVYAENFLADLNVKISTGRNYHKKISRLTQLFMKLNLQEPWEKANKTSMSRTLSHDLALMSDMSFSDLPEDTKRILGYYGISDNEWDVIRKNKITLEDDRDYIVSDNIENTEIQEKLTAYFIDRVNYATASPTGSTRARMAFGTMKATPMGGMLDLLLQFKTFMFSYQEKVLGRDLYAKGKADKMAIVHIILAGTVLAYLGGMIKDLLSNRTPKDPTDGKVFMESLVKSGGLSIAGDLFFSDTSGFNETTPTKYFGGPTFGRLDDAHKLYTSLINRQDARAKALNFAVNAIPFNNLFYVREPLNELMLYSIQEHLNPGYLNRLDKRNKERYNQEQLIETR